jgi:branched-chain amino acid transport system permease protein
LVFALVWFFQKSRTGRALRAVSDDHEAALSVGIPLRKAWAITWAIAGVVALVAGIMWGTRLGVQFSLSLIALKALPVLILGGIDSIPGAIIAGLIVGASENLAEVFIGPYIGGGIQTFFPYLLALLVLWFKPYGMFGREIIERV